MNPLCNPLWTPYVPPICMDPYGPHINPLDQQWTNNGPSMDPLWTPSRIQFDHVFVWFFSSSIKVVYSIGATLWTPYGPPMDPLWTPQEVQ